MNARRAGTLGVVAALAVAALWFATRPPPAEDVPPSRATRSVRWSRRDALGFAVAQSTVRDPALVREVIGVLGLDRLPPVDCPPDYSQADVTLSLAGTDAYARRSAYVFGLDPDAGESTVVVVNERGCRRGRIDREAFVALLGRLPPH